MVYAVLLCVSASLAAQETIQQVVRDPESLARFLESQRQPVDWAPITQALSIPKSVWLPCISTDRCETELLTLVDPHQTIIRASDGSTVAYLRYRRLARRGWVFSGAFAAFRHNHPQVHNVERFHGKPFLRISSQGYRGSDIDSLVEYWFDLTLPGLQPVFNYTIKGHERSHGFGIGRQFASDVEVKSEASIVLTVKMDLVGPRDNRVAQLEYRAVYERTGPGPFRLRTVLLGEQRVSNQDFELMLRMDPGPSEMALVRLSMGGLRKAATSRDPLLQSWVKSIVDRCVAEGGADSPQVREPSGLLQRAVK